MIVFWYVVSAIFVILGAVMLIWGTYMICGGVRQKDEEMFAYGVMRVVCAGFVALLFWTIDLIFGIECLGWIKIFVTENAVILRFVLLAIGVPLIMIALVSTKWFLIDTRKKIRNNNMFSEDDKELD